VPAYRKRRTVGVLNPDRFDDHLVFGQHRADRLGRSRPGYVDTRFHDPVDVGEHMVERGDEGGIAGAEHDRAVERHIFQMCRSAGQQGIFQACHFLLDDVRPTALPTASGRRSPDAPD
jgi:hypothetical protein